MTLPTFLGIGAPRSGTTWLADLMSSHPDVFVSTRRKEVHYFTVHYSRGAGWYSKFFPADEDAYRYRAIGEFTPDYLHTPECPARIRDYPSIQQLVAILRHPVDRFWSHFAQRTNFRGSTAPIEEFLEANPDVLAASQYARHLERYLELFGSERVLVLIFERAVAEPAGVKQALGEYFSIDPMGFPSEAGDTRVNASVRPRWPRLTDSMSRANRWLRGSDLDPLLNGVARVARRLKGPSVPSADLQTLAPEARPRIADLLNPEIGALERLLNQPIPEWQPC